MNLDFGILWIEDSYSPEEEENLRRRVLDAGFIARIYAIPNSDGIELLAKEHNQFHRFDIILLDYRLKGEDGNDLAPKIRELFPSTTILFYSGSMQENQLRKLIADKQVEGVYCCRRDQQRFIQRAGELIDQTTSALNRLSGMRGLAMRVVAECDELMKAAVLSMHTQHQDCANLSKELDSGVLNFLEELRVAYSALVNGDIESRLNSRAVDSAKLFQHFRRLTKIAAANPSKFGLNSERVDHLRDLRRRSAEYEKMVLGKRNTLGHAIEVSGENGWVLKGSSDISVSDFPEIRRTFAAHIDAIREMREILAPLN